MYPTLNPVQEQTPIEYVYFLEDGEQDPTKPNPYYFSFPQEWCTSNRGESIIGVRRIFMWARSRKIELTLGFRKYRRDDYKKLKENNKRFTDDQIYSIIEADKRGKYLLVLFHG
ncbi:hypothetical protein M9Y10_016100 [Tritrichomonas musculus]|uniref:Uncharacterized protein n=1 Tax=Tritrichomonas musculus TaxID=1915356 RepID=A0ABR2I5B6_9EUKA